MGKNMNKIFVRFLIIGVRCRPHRRHYSISETLSTSKAVRTFAVLNRKRRRAELLRKFGVFERKFPNSLRSGPVVQEVSSLALDSRCRSRRKQAPFWRTFSARCVRPTYTVAVKCSRTNCTFLERRANGQSSTRNRVVLRNDNNYYSFSG